MLRRSLIPVLFLGGAFLLAPTPALADVPPPNQCNSAGASCDNAPPDYKSPGVCTASKCQKALQDGSIEYDCTLCLASDAGGAGAGGAGTGGGSATGGGSSTGGSPSTGGKKSSDSGDDGGCSIGAPSAERTSILIGLALALGGLAALRRRRP